MKFKEIKSSNDIYKVIDKDTLAKAPLDGNITADWIYEQLFEQNCISHPSVKQKMLGYIGNIAVELQYADNTMFIRCIHGISDTTDAVILNKFSEIFNVSLEMCEESDESELIVLGERLNGKLSNTYMFHFYFGRYIGK